MYDGKYARVLAMSWDRDWGRRNQGYLKWTSSLNGYGRILPPESNNQFTVFVYTVAIYLDFIMIKDFIFS